MSARFSQTGLSPRRVRVAAGEWQRPESAETTLQLSEAPLANTSRYDSLRAEVAMDPVEVSHAS